MSRCGVRLQVCVSWAYWLAIHCGASSGSIAAMRASRPAKIATLWLSSICGTPPAPPKMRL